MTIQPSLPGFAPEYARFELQRQPDGYYELRVTCCQDRRYVSGRDSELYDGLSGDEAIDVIESVLFLVTEG